MTALAAVLVTRQATSARSMTASGSSNDRYWHAFLERGLYQYVETGDGYGYNPCFSSFGLAGSTKVIGQLVGRDAGGVVRQAQRYHDKHDSEWCHLQHGGCYRSTNRVVQVRKFAERCVAIGGLPGACWCAATWL